MNNSSFQVEEGNLISKGASKENEESSRSKKKMSGDNKRKDKWRSKDMPKKPNNPYVQFCLEQRSAIEEEHAAGRKMELSIIIIINYCVSSPMFCGLSIRILSVYFSICSQN